MSLRVGSLVMIGLVLLAACACASAQNGPVNAAVEEHDLQIVELSTGKDLYSAREEMDILLSIYAPENLSTVEIKITGVRSKKGIYYVSYSVKKELQTGVNNFSFTKKLPSCSACAGISQGTYFLDASVTAGDEVLTATHSIAITSKADTVIPVNVEVDEVKRWTENAEDEILIVDLRSDDDYNAGHVQGARSIPLENLTNQTAALNTSKKIVLYTADGSNSSSAGTLLVEQGFDQVYPVIGGLDAWNESGYAVVTTEQETTTPAEPGFELALAVAALMALAYVLRRR